MSEHMAGRTSGNVPTLTDHFKQALSMTRSQLQSGPSALSSASQMGVNGLNLNVPGALNPMGSVSNPSAVHPNAALNTLANLHNRPDIVYGAGQFGQSGLQNPSESPSGFVGAIQSYGKWILLFIIIMAGVVGAYLWWKKRQGKIQDNIAEDMQMPGRRPIHRSSGGMGGGMGTGMSIPIVSGGGNNVPPSSFNPSRFHPSMYQNPQSPHPMPENLRDNEQHGAARGAEFSNPSMVSHMMPMSTRVKPAEQTQNLPPQDVSNPQPSRTSHHIQQPSQQQVTQQPLSQFQSSLPGIPPVSQPINPTSTNLPISQPQNQPPNQQVNYPVGHPPSHVPDLPISPQPTQPTQPTPPQPSADPNFTIV